jgi:hypothetical protein
MNIPGRLIAVCAPAIRDTAGHCWRRLAIAGCLFLWGVVGIAQVSPPVLLEIDIENYVQYWDDGGDPSKFATDTKQRTTTLGTFMSNLHLGDIVAVNGRPAKGTYLNRTQLIRLSPTIAPGQTIADTSRSGGPGLQSFEILQPDGTPVGTIMGQWLVGGSPPPGSAAAIVAGNGAIIGGTGAFLGVNGQCGVAAGATGRNTTYAEDPSNRRVFGGGRLRMLLYIRPAYRPEIQVTADGPAVVHASDMSAVTDARPGRAGEILSLFATGLGPVRGNVDTGKPFPTSPLAIVNSPVEVTVNGESVEVISSVGDPDSVGGYQVTFRVPSGIVPGMAKLQVLAAWIPSSAVSIAIE